MSSRPGQKGRMAIDSGALRTVAKALRELKSPKIAICGDHFADSTGTNDAHVARVQGDADISVLVDAKTFVKTLNACAPIQAQMMITWTEANASITCGNFMGKMPCTPLVLDYRKGLDWMPVADITCHSGLEALAKFADKSKRFRYVELQDGFFTATDGFILARIHATDGHILASRHALQCCRAIPAQNIAPAALIGHKIGDTLSLSCCTTDGEGGCDIIHTRAKSHATGFVKIADAKQGMVRTLQPLFNSILGDKQPVYRIQVPLLALVDAYKKVCKSAKIPLRGTGGDHVLGVDHDNADGTLSLSARDVEISIKVDCPDYDISTSFNTFLKAGVLNGALQFFDKNDVVEVSAHQDFFVFETYEAFVIAMACKGE